MAFMAPIALLICDEADMDKLVGAIAVNCGALSGANFMTSGSGIIFRGLMDDAGLPEVSFSYSMVIFITSVVFSLILIAGFRYIPKKNRNIGKGKSFEKPEPFTGKQKMNLNLMITMVTILLAFPILKIFLPNAEMIKFINSKLDVGLVAIIFSAIALFLKLAPQKDVVAKVPWNTIIMISGVGMLINVAIKAGTIDLLASWAGSSLPIWSIPLAFSIVGASMSFFSSTLGVVAPALFPLVPILAESTGINPMILFVCIIIGAQSSAISPFSSGGSLVLGSCPSESEREEMFPRLLFIAVPISVISATLFSYILSFVL
jgi:di/tricarboxylate transporter